MDNTPAVSHFAATSKLEPLQVDNGLRALCLVAGYYRIAAQAEVIAKQLALDEPAAVDDLLRAVKLVGLKARHVAAASPTRNMTCFFFIFID